MEVPIKKLEGNIVFTINWQKFADILAIFFIKKIMFLFIKNSMEFALRLINDRPWLIDIY